MNGCKELEFANQELNILNWHLLDKEMLEMMMMLMVISNLMHINVHPREYFNWKM